MKKLIIALLFSVSLLFAQEVIVVRDYDLTIPADYDELKQSYIEMTERYLVSEAALERSIGNFKDLKIEYDNVVLLYIASEEDSKRLSSKITDELNPTIIDLEDQIDVLTKELEKWIKPDPFGLIAGVSLSNRIVPEVKFGVFLNLILFERVSIQLEYRFLDEYSVGIGYKF